MVIKNLRTVALVTALLLCAAPMMAQDVEDFAAGPGTPTEGAVVTTIPAMTVPTVVHDFDMMPAGVTTVADIQAAFPGSALADITTTFRAPIGVYNFQADNGRALAGDAAGTGALELVDPPAGAFGDLDDMTVVFSEPVSEFGMAVGDWSGPFNVEFYMGATLIEIEQVNTAAPDLTHFFASTTPFDNVVLTTFPDFPAANWVITELYIPEGAMVEPGEVLDIPTLGGIGLALLVGLLLLAGMVALRRRQTA